MYTTQHDWISGGDADRRQRRNGGLNTLPLSPRNRRMAHFVQTWEAEWHTHRRTLVCLHLAQNRKSSPLQ